MAVNLSFKKKDWKTGEIIKEEFLDNIEGGIEEAHSAIKNLDSQFSTLKDEMSNAKTDYFGEEHLNVVDRLTSDFDNVHQRINDSSYLEYSGSNITADNTYYGLTKEMSIKGRILQNLIVDVLKTGTLTVGTIANSRLIIGDNKLLKPNTKYTLIYEVQNIELDGLSNIDIHIEIPRFGNQGTLIDKVSSIGTRKVLFENGDIVSSSTQIVLKGAAAHWENSDSTIRTLTLGNFMILEGDYTNTPIEELPYGEGIYSVGENEVTEEGKYKISWKSCGKNLVDYSLIKWSTTVSKGITFTYNKGNNFIEVNGTSIDTYSASPTIVLAKKLKNGKTYIASGYSENGNSYSYMLRVVYYDGSILYRSSIVFDETIMKEISAYFNIANSGVTITNDKVYLQVEENTISTVYEHPILSYQELQLSEPLRSLPNGIADEVLEDGTEIRKITRLDLSKTHFGVEEKGTSILFTMALSNSKNYTGFYNILICNNLKKFDNVSDEIDGKGICLYGHIINTNMQLRITIPKNELSSLDLTGFHNWLNNNPITVYYELAEPIIKKHNKNINLKTFEGTTHITSDNYLQPTISCKVPSNVQAVLQDTRARNRELENELETTTLKLKEADSVLQEMDTDLIKINWEIDDRLFEVEWALEDAGLVTPTSTFNINSKVKGSASVMALSKFEQAKIIIMSGDYDRITLEGQLSKYLKRSIITQEEYDTLISMMDAKEIIVGE